MENSALISSPKLLLGSPSSSSFNNLISISRPRIPRRRRDCIGLVVSALPKNSGDRTITHRKISINGIEAFASISSSSGSGTSSVGVRPEISVPPPSSNIGSPLFWIGVGVGLSALFSWAATNLKKYAMQQAFKTMMGQMSTEKSPFSNTAFSPGSPFPFPTSTTSPFATASPATSQSVSSSPAASQTVSSSPAASQKTVDVPATSVEASSSTQANSKTEIKAEPKRYAFVDVSPEEVSKKDPFISPEESWNTGPTKDVQVTEEVVQNGAATKGDTSSSSEQSNSTRKAGSGLSVEALEKMMEDSTVQKMVFPYLPEEMRNPTTFKWMLQNPQYRQQLEDMLNNMGGSSEWDNKMMESLKNFDLSSPEVKQQFDQIGLTPEEVISKIMANPEIAVAFQNPRVQAAIMECSQNPLSIAKYQNDKEVMDVFNKISELFPGAA